MNLKVFIRGLGIQVLVGFWFAFCLRCNGCAPDDFDATTGIVGRSTNGFWSRRSTRSSRPPGLSIELPGMRPQALALSPDGKLLVTAGLTHELVVLDPATGKILQHVPLPADQSASRGRRLRHEMLSPD